VRKGSIQGDCEVTKGERPSEDYQVYIKWVLTTGPQTGPTTFSISQRDESNLDIQ
jgi:hypothetical protein